jgi:hypothetical protein
MPSAKVPLAQLDPMVTSIRRALTSAQISSSGWLIRVHYSRKGIAKPAHRKLRASYAAFVRRHTNRQSGATALDTGQHTGLRRSRDATGSRLQPGSRRWSPAPLVIGNPNLAHGPRPRVQIRPAKFMIPAQAGGLALSLDQHRGRPDGEPGEYIQIQGNAASIRAPVWVRPT